MEILRKGCQGRQIAQLQDMLRRKGFPIRPDGVFGQQTYLAVCQFQQKCGLTQDGIVGRDTWNRINQSAYNAPVRAAKPILDYSETVSTLGVEAAAVRAVCEIESGGRSGFFGDGRPIILFEGHIFWRELKKRGVEPDKYQAEYSDVLYPKWDKSKYRGGTAEYDRLNSAAKINEEAALSSASWGMFQIMGFNHKLCGYDTVQEYVEAIKTDPNNHLLSFARFLKNTGIDKPLRSLDWAGFAAKYNGPGYRQNQYDVKLHSAYLKYKRQSNNA